MAENRTRVDCLIGSHAYTTKGELPRYGNFSHGLLLPNLFLPSFSHTSTMAILFWLVFQHRDCIHYKRLRTLRLASSRVSRRRDPMTSHLRDLHWLPISYRIDFKIAVLTFRCLNGCVSSYSSSLSSRQSIANPGGRILRSSVAPSAHLDLVTPSVRVKTHGLKAFANHAIVWNKVPAGIRAMSTLSSFRKALKTHLSRVAFNIRV
jgi:hypothetical protein